MKVAVLSFGLAAIASANIVFHHVDLHCSPEDTRMYHGCLRHQRCLDDGSCAAELPTSANRSSLVELQVRETYSIDGSCGIDHGGTICNPNTMAYSGGCCSKFGWCGATSEYCGVGCQSGCADGTNPPSDVPSREDGRCGAGFGGATCDPNGMFGGCCSEFGYCGNTDAHCLTSNGCQSGCNLGGSPPVAMAKASTSSNTDPRSDGQCGSDFNGASCDPAGPFGGCCSNYGWCGSTPEYCLSANGCQLGCKDQVLTTRAEPIIAPVSSTMAAETISTAQATTDGTCGISNGGTACGNWPNGNCCSMYGFCGGTSAHCGGGCQSGGCLSAPAVIAPGAKPAPVAANGGSFKVVGQSGVPAMHAALMTNGRVALLDKVENFTQLVLPNGHYAYSAEYNPADNTVVPLSYKTNAFCSGGTFLADGSVISVGGNAPLTFLDDTVEDGFTAVRYLHRSSTDASLNGQNWSEPGNKLASARWYASVQTMPDGRVFVASGSLNGLNPAVLTNNNPTYEMLSPTAVTEGNNIPLEILEKNQPYYMYPFVHLLNDGTLFILVAKSCEQFSVTNNASVQKYPDIPGDYRTYPNTGGSVLLPLSSRNGWNSDVVVCGGGAYQDITSPTDPSCGRINPLSPNPAWEMDSMPEGRSMTESILLPDETVLWMNGGSQGAQGFGLCANPTLEALLYTPDNQLGQRWSTLASSGIPRLYHSCALLLLDGTVMVVGSSPNEMPVLVADANNPYATEFRVENYVPPYLQGEKANRRPADVTLSTKNLVPDGSTFTINFTCPAGVQAVSIVLYHGGFVTHSLHMGHRMLILDIAGFIAAATGQTITVTTPPNHNVCPPGPYVVYVMCDGVPAIGQFVIVG